MKIRKPRFWYVIATLFFLIIEILIALYVNDSFIRPYLGDLLATLLVYALIMSISKVTPATGIIIALLTSYFIELLQMLHIVKLLGLMQYKVARIIIGTSFSWMDLLMYTAGALVIALLEIIPKPRASNINLH